MFKKYENIGKNIAAIIADGFLRDNRPIEKIGTIALSRLLLPYSCTPDFHTTLQAAVN